MDKTFDEDDKKETWGRLIAVYQNAETPQGPFLIDTDQFALGRHEECDIQIASKKISGKHCVIYKEEEGGTQKIFVSDVSTNGTFINGKKIGKGKSLQIFNGDQISLSVPGNENVADEKQPTKEIPAELDATQEDEGLEEELKSKLEEKNNEKKLEEKEEKTKENNKRKEPPVADSENENKKVKFESFEENLICSICSEIFYKCISLVPCMHNFCQSCYGEWRERSKKCPQCRTRVKTIARNHAIQNLVETYVKLNPEKKRPEAELKELDATCKISDEMAIGKKKLFAPKHEVDVEGDDDVYSDEEYDEDDEDEDKSDFVNAQPFHSTMIGFGTGFGTVFGAPPMISSFGTGFGVTKCKECVTPGSDGFKCSAFPTHAVCNACFQLFPNRGFASTKCGICSKQFCDEYWGCPSALGKKALKKMKDHHVTDLPSNAMFHNKYEAKILKDFLKDNGKDVDSMYHEILDEVEKGNKDYQKLTNGPNTIACEQCAKDFLGEASYNYRASLKKEDFKDEVKRRPDCHWGKQCRTQTHNAQHAQRYNHVCEQTRFG